MWVWLGLEHIIMMNLPTTEHHKCGECMHTHTHKTSASPARGSRIATQCLAIHTALTVELSVSSCLVLFRRLLPPIPMPRPALAPPSSMSTQHIIQIQCYIIFLLNVLQSPPYTCIHLSVRYWAVTVLLCHHEWPHQHKSLLSLRLKLESVR